MKCQKILIILGIIVVISILVVPLITYGTILNNIKHNYIETNCTYLGYGVKNNTNNNYIGILIYKYDNITRYKDLYYSNNISSIITYFDTTYNNKTIWDCWYDKTNPISGWVGFHHPYQDMDGKLMIIGGSVILLVFLVILTIYLCVQNRRSAIYSTDRFMIYNYSYL